ncbi:hypothetical protein KIW84_032224 [Lathyrus oleraceus]|uniref:Translocon-associated protein subunit alpha n=1 Tax=Pisum sativum TaxID=3888 RepID=A0A9D4XV66_PEA|nr:hypothetical protein KIW84_032224 [Pisum sativum]
MALINNFWILYILLFLIASPLLQVVRCQSDEAAENAGEVSDIGIVGDETDDAQDFVDGGFPSAPGVDTICVFPKNIARLVKGGEEAELLVGLKMMGSQVFNNGSVPSSAQDSFPYIFSVSKFLQPGPFDLVGTIVYEMDQHPYQNTFYNGTIEVVSLVFYSAWNLLFFLLLELHFLSYLGYGLMVKYRTLRNQNSSICRKNNRDSNNILQHQ